MDDICVLRTSLQQSDLGVQIGEVDLGRPCTECDCPKGYAPHTWRKNCVHCKCSRDAHEVISEHGARSRLGLNVINGGLDARSLGYAFIPPGLTTARQVERYYLSIATQDVPRLATKGDTLRSQRLAWQLPKQDLSISACKFVEPEYASGYQDFITARNEIALDIGVAKDAPAGSMCAACCKPLQGQLPCISAPRIGATSLWHPNCFRCAACKDLLVDLAYCVYEDQTYCERHYSEQLKPRCASCDECKKPH